MDKEVLKLINSYDTIMKQKVKNSKIDAKWINQIFTRCDHNLLIVLDSKTLIFKRKPVDVYLVQCAVCGAMYHSKSNESKFYIRLNPKCAAFALEPEKRIKLLHFMILEILKSQPTMELSDLSIILERKLNKAP